MAYNKKKAYWPMWRNSDRIHTAVKRCTTPCADYMCLDVKVLYESDNFDKAREKLSNAVLGSNLETTDAEEKLGVEKVQKRRKRPNPKYNGLSSMVSKEEDIPAAPLRRSPRKNSFPEKPPVPLLPPLPSPVSKQKEMTTKEAPKQPSGIRPPLLPSAASPIIQKAQPRVTATEIKIISILEEIKGQVRFNTKLLQNIQTKVDVPFQVGGGGNEPEIELGIDFPLKNLADLDNLEKKLKAWKMSKYCIYDHEHQTTWGS